MKKLILFCLSMLIVASCETQQVGKPTSYQTKSVAQLRETPFGIKGADNAKFEETKIGKRYTYSEVQVTVTPSEDGVGEEIHVVSLGQKDTFWIENIEAHHFFGIKNNFLFVDNGTGPNGRTIVVYDLNSRQNIHEARYEKDISVQSNKMTYLAPIDTRNIRLRDTVCPDKDKWEKQGLSAGYAQYVEFDFQTKQENQTGNYSCYPIQ
jgi:hypothetical protein